jgi:hypothetical protein
MWTTALVHLVTREAEFDDPIPMDTDNQNDDDEPERIFWGGLFSQDKNVGSRVQFTQ